MIEAQPITVPANTQTRIIQTNVCVVHKRRLQVELNENQKRRSSSRFIKRKRFDDEIVEYSTSFTQSRGDQSRVGRPRTISQTFQLPLAQPIASQASLSFSPPASVENPFVVTATTSNTFTATTASTTHGITLSRFNRTTAPNSSVIKIDRRRARSNKRSKKSPRVPNIMTTKDLGRWKPTDDLTLVIGVLQTNDLRLIHRGAKFSCKFTFQEIQSRWYTLLYEPAISRLSKAAMRNLHPEQIEMVTRKALFSNAEEEQLGTIKSTENPKIEQFQELLDKYRTVFYNSRTAKTIQDHWHLMKDYQLLPDQRIKPLQGDEPMSFSDAEDLIVDGELNGIRDETLEIELALSDRRDKREIRLLEHELSRWHVLVDSMTNVNLPPDFDGQTLAVLRGRLVRYLMRSKEITFGRDSCGCTVDVDLALEGNACKISRRQGTIKLRSNGDFFIANEGKRPIFIDGVPLLTGNKARMANNCVVEICSLRFVFSVNYQLINAIRRESAKTTAPLN